MLGVVHQIAASFFSESNKKHWATKNIALIFWLSWGAYSLYLLSSESGALISAYSTYICLCIAITLSQKDILAPASIVTLMSFLSFGSNIPFIASGLIENIKIDEETLVKVTWIINLVVFSFASGATFWPEFLVPRLFRQLPPGNQPRPASMPTFIIIAAFVGTAGLLRLTFHLGEAGVQPKFVFAGYFQFILYEGSLMISLWFLSQSLKENRILVTLGLGLLISIAIIQALLSWRGAIFSMIILGSAVFWYQTTRPGQKNVSITWLVLLAVVAGNITQMGNTIRAERLGGEKEFAKKGATFIEQVIERSQGTTRLAGVLQYFGDITWDNNWLILEILEKGDNTTSYIDSKVYHIAKNQSHSIGTSGPGGVYTALGLIGVLLSYFSLGILYRISYSNMLNHATSNPMAIVLYAYLILILMSVLSENFNLLTLKGIIAVYSQVYLFDRFFLRAKSSIPEIANETPYLDQHKSTLFKV
jgi:hypothetical protein